MYSMAHFGVAAPIVLTSYALMPNVGGLAVGGILATASHYPVDYLKEAYIGKFFSKQFIKWDTMLIGITFIFGAFMGFHFGGWIGMFTLLGLLYYGFVCGIGMDLVDKKLGLASRYPDKYKATNYFHKQKTGIKCSVFLTKFAQIIGMAMVLVSIIVFLILKYKK